MVIFLLLSFLALGRDGVMVDARFDILVACIVAFFLKKNFLPYVLFLGLLL